MVMGGRGDERERINAIHKPPQQLGETMLKKSNNVQ